MNLVKEAMAEKLMEKIGKDMDISVKVGGANASEVAALLNHFAEELGMPVPIQVTPPAQNKALPEVRINQDSRDTLVEVAGWGFGVLNDNPGVVVLVHADHPGGLHVKARQDHYHIQAFNDNQNDDRAVASLRVNYTDLMFGVDEQVQEDGSTIIAQDQEAS